MIHKIFFSHQKGKDKVKSIVSYLSRIRGAKKAWKKRHGTVFQKHPEFNRAADPTRDDAHHRYWADFSFNYAPDTYRICDAISGHADPKLIPEEIFQADIEPSLNRMPEAHYLSNKSLYSRWFDESLFPGNLLHNIDGEFLDKEYNSVEMTQLNELSKNFSYPIVMKPNLDSWGGNEINFIDNQKDLLLKIKGKRNFVVQEKIVQHELLSQLHPPSLNTVRVYLYKSVKDNQVHIVNIAQRMGNGGALDNVASGGLVSLITEDGKMHGYALDRYGEKYETHPVTHLPFNQELPEFERMKSLAIHIATNLFHLRVVGLDLCFDSKGFWRVIEINTKSHSIRFAQYPGRPFFGDFMDEVKEYCIEKHWATS